MIEPNPTMGGAPVRVDGPMSGIMTGASGTLTVLSGDPHVQTWFWSLGWSEWLDWAEHEGAEWC